MHSWPVTIELDVLWGDMDALGHVNNTRFLTWFECARIATFDRIGLKTDPQGVGPILATTTCNFLQPVGFPTELTSGCRIQKVGNTSFTMEHGVWRRGEPSDLVATGIGVVVMVRYATGEKVRVPDSARAAIAAL